MTRSRWIGVALAGVLVAGATVTAAAWTRQWDKHTEFTFSGPVSVPGVTLPAGRYIFRVADAVDRQIIQVLSADRQRSYALFFGTSVWRTDIPIGPELRFMETGFGVPRAIESMWYPGQSYGYEFVYPQAQAELLRSGISR